MEQAQALKALLAGDHAIFTVEHGQAIGGAFGLQPEPHTFIDNRSEFKGITLWDLKEGQGAKGYSSHILAMEICDDLGLEYPSMFGVGSQLRACCKALERHLGA